MKGSLFTDPYSGHEVLHLELNGFSCGATYESRSAASLYPWRSNCRHCMMGRSLDFPAHVRRHVELLCTRAMLKDRKTPTYTYNFVLDQTNTVYHIVHWRVDDEQHVEISRDGVVTAQVHKRDLEDRVVQGDLSSKILSRETRFLMSQKVADSRLIIACARPLEELRVERARRSGRKTLCSVIEWQKILQLCEVDKRPALA